MTLAGLLAGDAASGGPAAPRPEPGATSGEPEAGTRTMSPDAER
jgi:hypothetical protein